MYKNPFDFNYRLTGESKCKLLLTNFSKVVAFYPFSPVSSVNPVSCVKYKSKRKLNQVNRTDKKIRRDCGLETAAVDKLLEPTMSCTTLPVANA